MCFLGLSLLGICLAPLVPLRENAPTSMGAGTAIITVSFPAIGSRPPAVVEAAATHVVEAALNRVAGVGHIDSYSDSYGGSVSLQLSPTADPDGARLEVATTLRRLWHSMPHWAGYPNVSVHYIGSQAAAAAAAARDGLYPLAPGSAKVVSDYADRHIRPALVRSMGKELSGVYISPNVRTPKATIIYSPDALNNYGLSPRDIAAAVSAYTSTGRSHNFVGYARGSVAPEPVFLSTATPAGRGIESARVKLPGGGDIALGEVARAPRRQSRHNTRSTWG